MGTVLCWSRKVFNSPYTQFKIFFIIEFQDLTSLSLKATIIFSQFLKDISIDFKTLVLFLSLQAKAGLRSDHKGYFV